MRLEVGTATQDTMGKDHRLQESNVNTHRIIEGPQADGAVIAAREEAGRVGLAEVHAPRALQVLLEGRHLRA